MIENGKFLYHYLILWYKKMFLPFSNSKPCKGVGVGVWCSGMQFWGLYCWGFTLLLGIVGVCLLLHLGTFHPHLLERLFGAHFFLLLPRLWWQDVRSFVLGAQLPEALPTFFFPVCFLSVPQMGKFLLFILKFTGSFLCPLQSASEPIHWGFHFTDCIFQL